MAASLRAGHSFLQALDTVAKEVAQPAAAEFQRVVAEVRLGRPAEDALEALSERVGSDDFKWAVLAVNIQREVGGNLAEILDNVSDTLRERAMLRRQIQVLTAEGRLSAWVLALLPIGIALYMSVVNPDYIGLLVTTTMGWVMVIVASRPVGAGDPLDAEDREHRCLSVWLVLAVLCLFMAIVLIGVFIDQQMAEKRRAVRMLETQVTGPSGQSAPSIDLREQEMSENFGTRVMVPVVSRAGNIAKKVTPIDTRIGSRRNSCWRASPPAGTPSASSRSRSSARSWDSSARSSCCG